MSISVLQADSTHLDTVAALFDEYRQFYQQAKNPTESRAFIASRFAKGDSLILLALREAEGVGMAQLYPSFSSVAMRRIWILNDLFVSPSARRHGVATELLDAASQYARRDGAKRLELATAHDNHAAQSLYRRLGWQQDTQFLHFTFSLDDNQ